MASSLSLGETLLARREELKLSMEQVAREMKIAPRYVEALEEGEYDALPAKVYAFGFLQQMLKVLMFEENARDALFAAFEEEWEEHGAFGRMVRKEGVLMQRLRRVTAMEVLFGSVALAAGLFLAMLFVRLETFVGTPRLIIETPVDGMSIGEPRIALKGTTDREVYLTVNGFELTLDESGSFEGLLELLPGLNELEFIAKNRFGKTTKLTRYVVVE